LATTFTIIGEVVLRVAHNLIAPRGVKQAMCAACSRIRWRLAQCEDYLRKMRQQIPSLEVLPAYDTAGAVKMVVKNGRHDEAAIASKSAAQVFAAHILASGIESNPQNFTRFFIMARPDRVARILSLARRRNARPAWCFASPIGQDRLYASLYAFAAEQVDLDQDRVAPHRRPTLGVFVLLGLHRRSQRRQRSPRAGRPGRRRRERAHLRVVSSGGNLAELDEELSPRNHAGMLNIDVDRTACL